MLKIWITILKFLDIHDKKIRRVGPERRRKAEMPTGAYY